MKIPNNRKYEELLLSTMLMSINALDEALPVLKDSDFFWSETRGVFNAIKRAYKKHGVLDGYLIQIEAETDQEIPKNYCEQLIELSVGADNYQEYLKEVRRLGRFRLIQTQLRKSLEDLEEADSPEVFISKVNSQLSEFDEGEGKSFVTAKELGADSGDESLWQYVQEKRKKALEDLELGKTFQGFSLGLTELDGHIGGVQGGELCVIAARPNMGKSAFALHVLRKNWLHGRTLIFSFEMDRWRLMERLISAEANIQFKQSRTGLWTEEEMERIQTFCTDVNEKGLIIEDGVTVSFNEIMGRTRRHHREFGIDALMIDHLGLIKSELPPQHRVIEVTRQTQALKKLAQELDIPVFLLCQLNRDVEKSARLPQLSDLRESGSIEQDADQVLFLHRYDVNDKTDKPGEMHIKIGKSRSCAQGTVVKAKANLDVMRIDEYERTIEEDMEHWSEQFNKLGNH